MLSGKLPIISLKTETPNFRIHSVARISNSYTFATELPELTNAIEDEPTKKLANEIFADSEGRLELSFQDQMAEAETVENGRVVTHRRSCFMKLCCYEETSFFQRLWDRYGAKVLISLHIIGIGTNLDFDFANWDCHIMAQDATKGPSPGPRVRHTCEGNSCRLSCSDFTYEFLIFVKKWKLFITLNLPPHSTDPTVQPQPRLEDLSKIYHEELCSDVIITVKNGVELKAHRCFLAASSPVFRKMFETKMQESIRGRVDIPDISEKGMRIFLKYIYEKDVEDASEDFDLLFELLCAAHKYEMPKLEALISEKLLSAEDADFGAELGFRLYKFVKCLGRFATLKRKSIEILKKKWNELEALPEYLELFQENIEGAMELCKDLALHKM